MTLSAEKRTAAALEAAGRPRAEIAEIVDRGEGTIKRWHQDEEYLKELDRVGASATKLLAPLVAQARSEAIEGARKAIETLVNALEATRKDGEPSWGIRVAAAQTLVGQPFRTGVGGGSGGGDEGSENGGGPSTAVIVVQGSPDAEVPDAVKQRAAAVIEAPASGGQ